MKLPWLRRKRPKVRRYEADGAALVPEGRQIHATADGRLSPSDLLAITRARTLHYGLSSRPWDEGRA